MVRSCPTSNASTSQGRTRSAHEGAPPEPRIASPQQPADGVVGTDWGVSIKRYKKKPRTRSPGSGYGVVEAAIGPVAPKHRPAKWGECLVRRRNGTGHPNIPNFDGSVLDDLVRCRQPGASPAFAITSSARAAVAATWMPWPRCGWCHGEEPCLDDAMQRVWLGTITVRCDAAAGISTHLTSDHTWLAVPAQRSGLATGIDVSLMNVESLRRRDTMRNGTVHVALASGNLAQSNSTCQLSLGQSDLASLLLFRASLGANQGFFFADDPVTVSSEHRLWRVRWGPA